MYAGVPTTAPSWVSGGRSPAACRARPKSRILTRPLRRFEPQVRRLDVAVDQPAAWAAASPRGHLPADARAPRPRSRRRSAPEPVVERLAVEELHGQERDAVVLADLVDGDDVVVLEGGGGAGLAQEARRGRPRGRPRSGRMTFSATGRLELRVLGLEDDAHAALAEQLEDPVLAQPADLVGALRRPEERPRPVGRGRKTRLVHAAKLGKAAAGDRAGRGRLPDRTAPGRGTPPPASQSAVPSTGPRSGVTSRRRPAEPEDGGPDLGRRNPRSRFGLRRGPPAECHALPRRVPNCAVNPGTVGRGAAPPPSPC